ncbi:MAG: hypothetical protein M1837_003460 [Sclerophora amabilis]|nr:MAG: hypothetical protein M1837_003460 [Sclerophora amabilis]
MEDAAEAALQLPTALRQSQSTALQGIHHSHSHPEYPLASQLAPSIHGLDPADAGSFQRGLQTNIGDPSAGQQLQSVNAYGRSQNPGLNPAYQNAQPQTPQHQANAGPFGVLTPMPPLSGQSHPQHPSLERLQQEQDLFQTPDGAEKGGGHSDNFKLIPNPPDLEDWREKLFHVNDTITLTEDQYLTYFPHVDNIYSHRSTQKYKRKPFVSHYWDCRLKGRPPGTPKSDDPNKKKRKRTARQRDLCDVKIKITEYFPQAMLPQGFTPPNAQSQPDAGSTANFFAPGQPGGPPLQQQQQPYGMLETNGGLPMSQTVSTQKWFTIQRVNGNGGNGKGDGVAGPHKHTLEDSDRVKKSSVQRLMLKNQKERKKSQVSNSSANAHIKIHDPSRFYLFAMKDDFLLLKGYMTW